MRKKDQEMLEVLGLGSQSALRPRTEYVTRTVIEKRAPTDESVRLLSEFEEAAGKKVVQAIAMKANNFFDVVAFKMERCLVDDDRLVYAVFNLNNETVELKMRLEEHEAGKYFWDEIAKEIGVRIAMKMSDAFFDKRLI